MKPVATVAVVAGRLDKTLFIGAIATLATCATCATCGIAHAQTARTGFEMMTDRKTSDAEERQRIRLEQERQRERRPLPQERAQQEWLLKDMTGRGVADGPTVTAQATPPKPVGQAPEKKEERPQEVAPIFQTPGVLTAPGRFIFEPSIAFAHATDNRVAIVGITIIPAITIGLVDVRRVSRDTFTTTLTGRVGLTNRMEFEMRLPYVDRHDTTITRSLSNQSVTDSAFDAKGTHLGDAEATVRYQLNDGGGDKPYFVGSLRYKSRTGISPFDVQFDPVSRLQATLPTGSGFMGLQPGVTVLIPSDPAVFFGGVTYMMNLKRDVGHDFGVIQPGNILGFNFGMGLALNDKATFSIGYDHAAVAKTKQINSDSAVNQIGIQTTSQIGTLLLGYSYRVTPSTNMNLSLGVGVTRDAPDMQLTLRLPMSF